MASNTSLQARPGLLVDDLTNPTQQIPLVERSQNLPQADTPNGSQISWKGQGHLYTSHLLSTWNSRLFEFGAVLFLAAIFPHTLLQMSIYALIRSAAAIIFAQSIGSWIDHGNRLTVIRWSIAGQRVAVIATCCILWIMEKQAETMSSNLKNGLFVLTVMLACVEKLASTLNLVSIERDWVVVISNDNENLRLELNARLRRIDLLCKLLGPLIISLIAIASTLIAIWATLGMNVISLPIEWICIERVYKEAPALANVRSHEGDAIQSSPSLKSVLYRVVPIASLPFYIHHPAFLPSLSLALLYLTVLSFSGQMITFLISIGYTSAYVGLARSVSTILELSATWIAPRLMKRIGTIRTGIWSLSWLMLWLAGGVSWLFAGSEGSSRDRLISATGMTVFTAMSRIGLWGYDLSAQMIVQDEVEASHRGTFSTVEAAFQNLAELLSFATTMIFARPDQFKWPTLISAVSVYAAGGLYTLFVRRRRGHLFHMPRWINSKSPQV